MMTVRKQIIVGAIALAGVVGLGIGAVPVALAVASESDMARVEPTSWDVQPSLQRGCDE